MDAFWGEVKYVLEALVIKAIGQDRDGMDLKFTSGDVAVQGGKTWRDFRSAMNDPKFRPISGFRTTITEVLGNTLANHIRYCKRYGQDAKNLTLLVLTDGIWAGEGNTADVEVRIIDFIETLVRTIGNLQHRPVGIQFIQFGKDARATQRLGRLDRELVFKKPGIPLVTLRTEFLVSVVLTASTQGHR